MQLVKKYILLFIFLLAFIHVSAQRNYRINDIKFDGNKTLSNESLYQQMNSIPRKSLEKLFFWKKAPSFNLSLLNDDVNRLKSFYVRNGFPNSNITYTTDTVRYKINVNIKVEENHFVTVNKVSYQLSGDSSTQFIIDSLKSTVPIKENQRFSDDHIFKTEAILQNGFYKYGYPFAHIDYQIGLNKAHSKSDITFNIDSDKKYFFGDISIHGDSLIPQKFIKKHISFAKNETYIQQNIDDTQRKLFDTELFLYVIIKSIKDSIQENRIPVQIWVKELPRWSFEGGVGFGTDDRVRLSTQITRLNFLGGTRRLVFKAKTSHFVPFSFDIKFIQPDLYFQNLDFALNPFFIREREISYQIDRIGGSLNFVYHFNKRFNLNLSYALERDRLLELDDLQLDESELRHDKSIIGLGGEYSSTNSKFYPTQGYKIGGNISYAGLGFSDDIHYYQALVTLHKYHELTDNLSLAFRLKSGIIEPTENTEETPIEERFFAGGASSLRGWSRNSISPLNDDGFVTGGNTLLEASTELRFPIYDIFGGVVFMDAGNVWQNSYQYNLSLLRYNAGVGIRVKSPIGPIRLDMASPIIKDSFNFQFFISIGQTF